MDLWRRLFVYLKPYRIKLLLIILAAIVSSMFMVFAPFVIGLITTTLFDSIKEGVFYGDRIISLLIALACLYGVSQLFAFIQGLGMSRVSASLMQKLREDIYVKLHSLKLDFYDQHSHGDLLSTMTNDIEMINNMLSQNLTNVVVHITTAIGVLIMMLFISPSLTCIPLLIVPLSLFVSMKVMKQSEEYYTKQQNLLGELNGYIEEMYQGQSIVQTFNYQETAMDTFIDLNENLKQCSRQAEISAGAISPITTVINDLGYVLCAFLGCLGALQGVITIGSVQAMLEYTWRFTDPISAIASMVGSVSQAQAAAIRVFALLDEEEEVPDVDDCVDDIETKGKVVFKHVSFGYDPKHLLIKDLNLEIKPGQKVAIVGPTGAGKTTLIQLLMRFYDVNSGCIEIDGVNIQKMTRSSLRKRFGMVLQDAWLFEGTIKENIGYALDDYTDEDIIEATEYASAHQLIQTMPGGYDMVLTKGAENISQGERQLMTIARAIAAKPDMMILDEATSNIDTHTESLIQQAMDRVMEGKTSFIIAHRLSTIRTADIILYMENGDVKEMGDHETLMAINGRYASLYNSQYE